MSLRGFHIVFIVLASLMAFFVGIWGISQSDMVYFITGILSLILGGALVWYGIWYLRKMTHGRSL